MKKITTIAAAIISSALLTFALIGCSSDSDTNIAYALLGNGGGVKQPSSESTTKFKCTNCQTEYETKELADNCDKQPGCPNYSSVKYKCTNCHAEYSSQALADACDKELGCPEFKVTEHKDKVYYWMDGAWLRYDKTTGEITQAWLSTDEIMGVAFDIYIPAASYKETLDSYGLDDEDNSGMYFGATSESEEYQKMLNIINDETTKKYTVDYMDALPLIQTNLPWKFTEDIKIAFKNKSAPVLPEKLKDHNNLLYLYLYTEHDGGSVYIVDFDDMKMYTVDYRSVESEENQIVLGSKPEHESEVKISAMMSFPDLETKTPVENPTGYSLVQYPEDDYDEACIELGKVQEGMNMPPKAKVFADKDGNYFIDFPGL